MSELKATPGPWEVIFEAHQWLVGPEERTFKDVFYAVATRVNNAKLGNTDKANARLIASAPEMYEALDLLVKEIKRIDDESRVPLEDHEPDLVSLKDHAKGVLAKARGE